MFGPLIIDEGPSLSTTAGRAVAQLMLLWWGVLCLYLDNGHNDDHDNHDGGGNHDDHGGGDNQDG